MLRIRLKRLLGRTNLLLSVGVLCGVAFLAALLQGSRMTSTDSFCESCHVHPQSTISWKLSTHYKNKSGIVVHCVQCHLPPEGLDYYTEKATTGSRDIYGRLFKDVTKIDWDAKSRLDYAKGYTYDEACLHCHQDLYSLDLSTKGIQAHENYVRSREKGVACINCHLHVGHYSELQEEQQLLAETPALSGAQAGRPLEARRRLPLPPPPAPGPRPGEKFADYVEEIPGTPVRLEMMAIAGGEFDMGSPVDEPYRRSDEGPVHRVKLSPFWMAKAEVSWDVFEEFYSQTVTHGKNERGLIQDLEAVDAISGPTPPYGSPDQGWGKGEKPAITMTHHAARVFCAWLTRMTGKRYRLPTEAEWEYSCRAGSKTPYFFPGEPGDFTRLSWLNRWFGVETDPLARYAWYAEDSSFRTHLPSEAQPNPWGLLNMIGNVKEFCLDWYDPQAYSQASETGGVVVDPMGPESGEEHVIRGGSYKSDAVELRSAARGRTRTEDWLATDPQSPKSIWWYSDSNDVGFRVVRRFEGEAPQAVGGAR
jgi:sulfatase modifying factor 1